MRIGFDASVLLSQRTGIGHYTGRLLTALLENYPQDDHLLFSKMALPPLGDALAHAPRPEGHLARSHALWLQVVLPRLLAREQVDLCHCTNEIGPLRSPCPLVLTIHDASIFLFPQYHPRRRRWMHRLLVPPAARRARVVITATASCRQDLQRILGLPAERIVVIPDAAPGHFQPVTDGAKLAAVRHRYRLPDNFLLYVGALEPRKNLSRLVTALSRLQRDGRRPHLVLAGPTGWLLDSLDQEIEAAGLAAHVQHLGYVPTSDLPALFSAATAFVYPSLYEGFGLPVLESMACGAPVLTSNSGALAEVAGDAAELIDPTSVDHLAAGLRRLLDDGQWRAELRRRGLERAATFSWRRTARATHDVYEQIVNVA